MSSLFPLISNIVESEDKHTLNFTLSNVNLGIANGLRRILLGETPSFAIDLVEFESNTSVLDDDCLAHRIGLITIQSENVDNFRFKHECDCEYACDLCSVKIVCDVVNQTNDVITVTTGNLLSCNPDVECARKDIPIVKLGPREELRFSGIACKDIGNEHTKFCPVNIAICNYKVDPKANIKTRFQQENNPQVFEFEIETNSSMKAMTALRLAIDILIRKLENFESLLNKL